MGITTITQPLPNSPHRLDLTLVQGGFFRMGSDKAKDPDAYDDEQPDHDVQVTDFYMANYPVTQALWRAVVDWAKKENPGIAFEPNPSFFTGDDRPVEQISWDEAKLCIQYLNEWTANTLMRQAGYTYRLPTEAEWEYAARGGIHSNGYKYAGSDLLKEVGWYDDNSHGETKAVGQKAPNELGLYDMSGNVWEWCEDDWHDDYKKAPKDSKPWIDRPERGTYRVFRGGAWDDSAQDCRPACRNYWYPGYRDFGLGFRLVFALQSVG